MSRGKVLKTRPDWPVESETENQSGLKKCLKSVKNRSKLRKIDQKLKTKGKFGFDHVFLGGGGVESLISHLGGVWGISAPNQQYRNPQILSCKPECQAFDNGFH